MDVWLIYMVSPNKHQRLLYFKSGLSVSLKFFLVIKIQGVLYSRLTISLNSFLVLAFMLIHIGG